MTVLVTPALAAFVVAGVAMAAPTASRPITGGHTDVVLDTGLTGALAKHNIDLIPTGSATLKSGDLRLAVTGGTSSPPDYVVQHSGGFKFASGGKSVTISDLTIKTKSGDGIADVTGLGRVTALSVGSPNRGNGGANWIEYGGYSVSFTDKVVKRLDNVLNTSVFAAHSSLGTGDTTIHLG